MGINEDVNMDPGAAKLLSQREIDLLLGNLEMHEGGTPAGPVELTKSIRPYDFRRPDKFSKDHLRALQTINETFARGVTSELSSYLRTGIQVRVASIDQAVYGEYIQRLPNPTVMAIVSVEPLTGHILIETNFKLAFALVDRLLGGPGRIVQKAREVTDIEMVLLETLMKALLPPLREAWLQIVSITVAMDDMIFNPQIVQAALPGDIGVLLLFELRIGEASDIISMFVPYTVLEPIIDKLSSQMWLNGVHRDSSAGREEIRTRIEKVDVPVTVNIGATSVSIRELLGLQKGNVIRLNTGTNEEMEMLVGGRHKYMSRPGRVGRRLAVGITRVLQEECFQKARVEEAALP